MTVDVLDVLMELELGGCQKAEYFPNFKIIVGYTDMANVRPELIEYTAKVNERGIDVILLDLDMIGKVQVGDLDDLNNLLDQ